jgi:phosphoglycolate phosphatase
MLDALQSKDLQMAVLSNKPHALTEKVVAFYLSDWPFTAVFGQRDEVPRKPDPAGALEIAALMDLEPGRVLFVGDSNNDILTATAAGMVPLAVNWGYGRLSSDAVEGTCAMINRPSEIVSYTESHH